MNNTEYLLTWQWNTNTNSFNTLTTIHKSVVDNMLNNIKDRAVNIKLISYEQ